MSEIILCRDGILRQRERMRDDVHGLRVYDLPVRTIQKVVDPQIFFRILEMPLHLEDGLTVREMFLNLQPWGKTLRSIAEMDFDAFCDEALRPPERDNPDLANFSHVEVAGHIEIGAVPSYERVAPVDDSGDVLKMLGMGNPLITDRYELGIHWDSIGRLHQIEIDDNGHEIDGYSLDGLPINEWAHLPLRVNDYVTIQDTTQSVIGGFLSTKEPVLNPNHPAVSVRSGSSQARIYEMRIEYGATLYESILRGCVFDWGFHGTPEERDNVMAALKTQMGMIFEGRGDEYEDDLTSRSMDAERDYREMMINLVMQDDSNVRVTTEATSTSPQ